MANQLNRLGNRSTGCPCSVEVWSRGAKNTLTHPIASSSRLRFTPSRSTSGRGSIEVWSRQRSLPSKWHTKVTAIQEAKDLTKLPMEELIGSLMTYVINLAKKLQEGEDKKKKSIALKATTKEEEDVEEEKPSEEDDLALITRKLNKYMRNERFRGRKFTSRRDLSKRESSSHGDKEKWEDKRDLAMMATWSDSEESSEEEKKKEVANMCFMAIDDLDEGSKKNKWLLYSGCSRHMTEDESKFAFFTKRKRGYVTFGDNAKGGSLVKATLHDINHNFPAPRTPQQNGVVERKNRTLQEMARTMLNENNLPKYFWAEAVNTSCYVLNRILLRPILKKTPYELWKNKKPNISYFKVFGCKCFILNTKHNLGKFDAKSDVGIFLGYSTSSKVFRVFNKRTMVVEESIHVIFYESNNSFQKRDSLNDDLSLETSMGKLQIEDRRQQEEIGEDPKKKESPLALPPPQQVQGEPSQDLPKDWKFVINHPQYQIIGNPSSGVRTRSSLRNICNNLAFISQIEPKNINDALVDENWMIAMQEELNQFERSEVWELVSRPSNQSVIGTR
uniref:Integrase catalytic domain-containing protein n=1 Tax=Vitis vinifera TaxID=29760 RepID=A5AJ19_VITVI|nr:hypothetical protein VITISV_027333 [Vitis vinifera]